MAKSADSIRKHKIHFYRQIAFTFIGAALVVLVGLIYFSLSQAVIIVKPNLEKVSADFNVLVKADTDQTQEGIKAKVVETDVQADKTSPAELLQDGDPQPATGTVTLKNSSKTPQPLVGTTRLLSDGGVLFRLKKSVTVPANGQVDADVYADKPGKDGEIAPSRFTIPGLNQSRQQEVYGQSMNAMTGGTKAIYQVTQKSIDAAIAAAKDSLETMAKNQLEASGVKIDQILPNASWVKVVSQDVKPTQGSAAATFTVSLKAQVAFVMADPKDFLQLAQKQLYATTTLGYELSSSDEGSFTYSISNYDADKKTAQVRVVLQGNRRISANNPLLNPANFVGQKPNIVKQQLEADPGIDSVDIQLRPFWLRSIPRLVDHIYIQFAS